MFLKHGNLKEAITSHTFSFPIFGGPCAHPVGAKVLLTPQSSRPLSIDALKSYWDGLELLGHPVSGIRVDKWIPNHLWDWIPGVHYRYLIYAVD